MKQLWMIVALLASGLCSAGAQTPSSTVATPETGSNALITGALGLCAALGIALALAALYQIKKLKEEKNHEVAALKTALKQRNEEVGHHLKSLSAQLAQVEERLSQRVATQSVPQQKPKAAPPQKPKAVPTEFFASRADEGGFFSSVSSRMEPGNSIFRLSTADGVNATFEVICDAGVHQLALMMPTENLTRACTGENIQISAGKTRIVCDAPGTAKKEGNRWRIVKPAVIHYE
ncbi:MAG: hypothetical protein KIG57_05970 [Muribaculaceae bacterium]|nr:hypothetical protein [Muribaculaceae bacterium]